MARSIGELVGIMMNGSTCITLALVGLSAIVTIEAAVLRGNGCTVSINYADGDLKEPQPLILVEEKTGTGFLHPVSQSCNLELPINEKVLIACPGNGNSIQGISGLSHLNEIEATCIADKVFSAASKRFDFTNVTCKFLPKHEARRTKTKCYGNATHVEIGFNLKNTFLRTIDICRDDKTMMTHWTKFSLTPSIDCFQQSYPRPNNWKADDFYGNYDINLQYKTTTELKTITKLLGSKELAKKYINPNANLFMARGHMTAKADFVYGAVQASTFWFLNAAPQWQSFNAGNWNTLEGNVRHFSATRNSDLEVYTGAHGQMSLTDINGNKVPIYLYADGDKRAFPVPKFYWKVIYDRKIKRGTAFIGSNDPWAEKISTDMFLCEDIARDIKWLTWQPENIFKGVSYACRVDDLRKAVPSLPSLKVNDILA